MRLYPNSYFRSIRAVLTRGKLFVEAHKGLLLGTWGFVLFVAVLPFVYPQPFSTAVLNTGLTTTDAHELQGFDMEMARSQHNTQRQDESILQTEFRKSIAPYKEDIPISLYEKYYDLIGLRLMMSVLEERQYCHSEGHNLGRVLLEKTKDFGESVQLCGSHCSTGCFHGVLMAALADHPASGTDLQSAHVTIDGVQSRLTELCTASSVQNKIGYGVCVHGVGHAIGKLTGVDIEDGLRNCASFTSKGEEYYCATGVFMERDIEQGASDAKVSSVFPCDQSAFPAACYRYKLRRSFAGRPASEVNSFCSGLPDARQRQGCFHGLGFSFFAPIMANPMQLGYLCKSFDPTERRVCIEGAVGIASVVDSPRALAACATLIARDKSICEKAVRVSNFGMERDFDYYPKTNF